MQIKKEKNSILLTNNASMPTLLIFGIPGIFVSTLFLYVSSLAIIEKPTFFIGWLFLSASFVSFWVIKTLLYATLPHRWELTLQANKTIKMIYKLFGIQIKKIIINEMYRVFASPTYQRGDWGYCLGIISPEEKKLYITPALLKSEDINVAKQEALQKIITIAGALDMQHCMLGWDKYENN